MEKILVGMDLNPEFEKVLNYAKKMSKLLKAKLYIVHTETIEFYIASVVSETGIQPSLELIEENKKRISIQLKSIQEKLLSQGINSECMLLEGNSTDIILKRAEEIDADLIILGAHKHGKFYNLFLGSTHDQIINKSHIPVLIVPAGYKPLEEIWLKLLQQKKQLEWLNLMID